jgi:hypothetical protein
VPSSSGGSGSGNGLVSQTDFPPLPLSTSATSGSVASPPRPSGPPVGAWTNSSSTRQILTSAVTGPGAGAGLSGKGGQAEGQLPGSGLDEKGFERPPPKGNTELFNPKNKKAVLAATAASGAAVPKGASMETQTAGEVDASLSEVMTGMKVAEST